MWPTLPKNARFSIFDKLDKLVPSGEKFGLIVLDPPKFARAGHSIEEALRGYRRLQSQAIKLMERNGILVICCCSGLIHRDMLSEVLSQVAADAKRLVRIIETRGPSRDHPASATCPESNYLKCLICAVE